MRSARQDPFLSPAGCLGGVLLVAGIAIVTLFSGGAIFSPGALTAWAREGKVLNGFASHAEFENDCQQCHAPLQGIAVDRCENCHADVQAERLASQGVHGALAASAADCAACHPDHRGRELNPNTQALQKLDHDVVGFGLEQHLADFDASAMRCTACHREPHFEFEPAACSACHINHDAVFVAAHVQAFGARCLACHDGLNMTAGFDHAQTDFALAGQHAGLECGDCHRATVPVDQTPTECTGCHAEPSAHAGAFDPDCATCHTAVAWSPARLGERAEFQHAATGFQLLYHAQDYAGRAITCQGCHAGPDFSARVETCAGCHAEFDTAFVATHTAEYGPNCVSCHDGAGNMRDFDHNQVFVLDGRHADLACGDCHEDQLYGGTPRECAACHAEPEFHAGLFGLDCAACHASAAWAPAQLTRHAFPLDHGGEGEAACAVCHADSYAAYTCSGCHEHEPAQTERLHAQVEMAGRLLADCAACHPDGRVGQEGR